MALGFTWDTGAVDVEFDVHTVERAVWRFRKTMPGFVWDAAVLEGNPFTYPEVQTLMEGVTVGGHKVSDERQVLALAESMRELADLVVSGRFALDKPTSDRFQYVIARDEALEAGHFRGEGSLNTGISVNLGEYDSHIPPAPGPGGSNLIRLHEDGLTDILALPDPVQQAIAYFLFAALNQFSFDGNKRTGRAMMNGHLMAHGIDAISVPAARRLEFNALMVDFYRTKDATGMFAFLLSCHPDADG
jgi:Fic family protein